MASPDSGISRNCAVSQSLKNGVMFAAHTISFCRLVNPLFQQRGGYFVTLHSDRAGEPYN